MFMGTPSECAKKTFNMLSFVFDKHETRTYPLEKRIPFTKKLEVLLSKIIDCCDIGRFLEIGAFEADFSINIKRKHPDAIVMAFEANPVVAAKFGNSARRHGVDYREVAIGRVDGTVQINVPVIINNTKMPDVNRMASLYEIGLRDSTTYAVDVPSFTLDTVSQGQGDINTLLWIDVEGAADAVIDGAKMLLNNVEVIICEVESRKCWI